MSRTGYAHLPLHGGKAPRYLFERMVPLSREIVIFLAREFGRDEVLRRLSDPYWFQAFGCVLGFDWHSSGLTTTACAALKEGPRGLEAEVGLTVAGGKGRASRRTPAELNAAGDRTALDPAPYVRASRLSAKVDSSAVQDGFQVYHHTFVLADDGRWAVVQQGMNEASGTARRYHWLTTTRFDADPHAAVAGDRSGEVLNLVAGEAKANRAVSAALAREGPGPVIREIGRMRQLEMPHRHAVRLSDIHPDRLDRVLVRAYEAQPQDYTSLLAVPGVGAKGLRALALVAELAYGEPASVRDPVSFTFAHGGKDGTPFPVDRRTYDATIESLRRVVAETKAGRTDKQQALKRLARLD